MAKRGRTAYWPRFLLDEVEDIMREDEIPDKTAAKFELIKYARVGREAKRMITLDWSKKGELPRVPSLNGMKKKKGRGGLLNG